MVQITGTLATLKMANDTVKECWIGLVVQCTEESFATVREKVMASTRGSMVKNTSASGLMINVTEKVLFNGPKVKNIKEDGRRTIHMEQEFT